jgi:2-polyprenyl-3-methyl-5-hydroxy-6-metoxy-1,4-benzoquinol methylase
MASESESPEERRRVVQSGYDAIGAAYSRSRRLGTHEALLLERFSDLVPPGGWVLDAGCGAGVPVAQWLSRSFQVTGVDISRAQIELARKA